MTSLAIRRGSVGRLHHEVDVVLDHVSEEPWVQYRTEIVGVGDERILDAAIHQEGQGSGGAERRVEITVSWGAPLQSRVRWRLRRRQIRLPNLGRLVLEEVQRQVGQSQSLVACQGLQALVPGPETVHEQGWNRRLGLLTE
jgi:hypothetical protein